MIGQFLDFHRLTYLKYHTNGQKCNPDWYSGSVGKYIGGCFGYNNGHGYVEGDGCGNGHGGYKPRVLYLHWKLCLLILFI